MPRFCFLTMSWDGTRRLNPGWLLWVQSRFVSRRGSGWMGSRTDVTAGFAARMRHEKCQEKTNPEGYSAGSLNDAMVCRRRLTTRRVTSGRE
jgi:hypothetical protein